MAASDLENHLTQIHQTLVCMGQFMKEVDPVKAKKHLATAVYACRKNPDIDEKLPMEIYQRAFPGEELPPLSD